MQFLKIGTTILLFLSLGGCVTGGDVKKAQDQLDNKVKAGEVELSAASALKKYSGDCIKIDSDNVGSYTFTPQDQVILQKDVDGVKSYSYFKIFCGEWNPKKFMEVLVIGSHAGGGIAKAFMVIPLVFLFDENHHQVQESSTFVRLNQGAIQFGEVQEIWSYASKNLKTRKFYLVVEPDNKNSIDTPRGHTNTGIPFYPYPAGEFKLSYKSVEL